MRALITGGTHGIGAAIAKNLLIQGSRVILIGRSIEKYNAFAKELSPEELSRVVFLQGNVRDDAVYDKTDAVLKEWDGVDYLVNNVGGGGRWGSPDPVEAPLSLWGEVMDTNVAPAIDLMRRVLPYIEKKSFGRIVSIASIYGKESPEGGRPWFITAKASLIAIMKSMSKTRKYTEKGITFNTISPGPLMIEDTGWAKVPKESIQMFIRDHIPSGFIAGTEDVVKAFNFIVDSPYVNGANIVVDGGMSNSY